MSTTIDPITTEVSTEVSTSSLSTTNSIDMLIEQRDELLAQNEELEDEVGGLKTDVIGLSVGVVVITLAIVLFFVVSCIIICRSKKIRNKSEFNFLNHCIN